MTTTKRTLRRVCQTVAVLLPMLATQVATADPSAKPEINNPDDNARVRALFHDGEVAYEAGKYEPARQLFLEAWSVRPTYDVASSLAQVELKLHRFRDAAEYLDYCLQHFAPSESAKTLERVRKALAEAKTHVATVTVMSDRDGAEIFVDALQVGTAPLSSVLFVDPGARRIAARYTDGSGVVKATEQSVSAEAGKEYSATLRFGSAGSEASTNVAPVAPPVVEGPKVDSESNKGVQARTIALWTGVGATAIAAGVGTVFALKGASANHDAKDAKEKLAPGSCPSAENLASCAALSHSLSDRESANKGANIAFVVAGVAAVATVTTFFVWQHRHSEATARIRLVPVMTRESSGLLVNAVF